MCSSDAFPEVKKKIILLFRDTLCTFSSDFDNALFNSVMAPNPAAATWEIPRRQGVGGKSGSAVPSPALLASLALPCRRATGGSSEDEMGSRGTRLEKEHGWDEEQRDSSSSSALPTRDRGEGSMVPKTCCCCLLSPIKKYSEK